ncbi:MAG: DUF1080 domain-containing protein [Saprospiraceae bacterium]|nr:DUF1080 domain-containing protein [Saprospiraceae bacterium]
MKNHKLFIACLIVSFVQNASFAQIKLKKLGDFQPATGEWFEASAVALDSGNNKLLTFENGEGVLVNGPSGRTEHLVSKQSFGDVELHIEFLLPKGSNSGVYLQSKYEVQIFDSYGKEQPQYSDCGGIYERWDKSKPAGQKGYEGIAPRTNACLPLGQWQSFDILFRAPRFDATGKKIKNAIFEKVALNGIIIHQNKAVSGTTRSGKEGPEVAMAPLMLQGDHGPVAYRNIRIRTLDNVQDSKPNEWVDLFNETSDGPDYDFVVHGNASQAETEAMFQYEGGELKVMYDWDELAAPHAMAVTKKTFSHYDLKLEFKWGERRFEPRRNRKRDAGLLYHCQVGTYAWPPSLEYQIQEGDCGDLWSILNCRCDVLKDGKLSTIKVADYSRSMKWSEAEREGWNEILLEVRGDKARYYLNGTLVNEIVNASYGGLTTDSGFIGLQAEYAELTYRNIQIRELPTLKE